MRIIGYMIILATTTFIGFRRADDYQNEYRQMCYVQRLLQILEGEINYSHVHLQDIFNKMARQASKPYKQWLYYLSENTMLTDKNFEIIWKDSIEGYLRESGLPLRERKNLVELGRELGIYDKELQLRLLQLYEKEFAFRVEEVRKKMKDKMRLCQCLGISSGIFIIILLM